MAAAVAFEERVLAEHIVIQHCMPASLALDLTAEVDSAGSRLPGCNTVSGAEKSTPQEVIATIDADDATWFVRLLPERRTHL
ncbi:MAG: hypothetical protein JWN39_2871 [Ilumatobacteraceae bacterium]|nr:hypothetical protein [Ilumatobacteraceae bacterium]